MPPQQISTLYVERKSVTFHGLLREQVQGRRLYKSMGVNAGGVYMVSKTPCFFLLIASI